MKDDLLVEPEPHPVLEVQKLREASALIASAVSSLTQAIEALQDAGEEAEMERLAQALVTLRNRQGDVTDRYWRVYFQRGI
jgi:hypothetical protein